ncbi:MAG: STAS domain-containing protein [Planctomycetota bacterium]
MSSPTHIEYREEKGTAVVTPFGEIGYPEAAPFRAQLKQAQDKRTPRLVVDLSNVAFMNTPGLATLVEALQTSRRTNTALVLCGLQDRVRAVFEIARLHTVFKIVGDLPTAMTP